jgi:hypothetical protein
MSRRSVERALKANGCEVLSDDGKHTAPIPRHRDISPGVVRDTINKLACLPKGWLQ